VECERLCRYTLRPPLALTRRLRLDAEGRVCLAMRHQWSDGTTHLWFEPVALLERLVVLITGQRINLVLYYGVLAPWRPAVAALAGSEWSAAPRGASPVPGDGSASAGSRGDGYLWAD